MLYEANVSLTLTIRWWSERNLPLYKQTCLVILFGMKIYLHDYKKFTFSYILFFYQCLVSQLLNFTCTGCFRKILLYPKGKDFGMGTHLSLYLAVDLETLPAGCRLCADYTLRIVNQVKDRKLDLSAKGKNTNDLFAGLT